jgi:hypothetical protein
MYLYTHMLVISYKVASDVHVLTMEAKRPFEAEEYVTHYI